MRVLSAAIELAGLAAILVSAYLLNPVLLLGLGGLVAVAAGNAIDRRPE